MSGGATSAPLLEIQGLSKRFGAIAALEDVTVRLESGEVVAVVGENGAGKSTLIKILAGVYRADAGRILLREESGASASRPGVDAGRGRPASFAPASPAESMASGVAVIHQELHLADNLSIAANIFLGREPLRWRALGILDRRRMETLARAALERVGLDRDPREPVAALSPAARQLVEIARALAMEARVVVMDEPTSSLGGEDTATLLDRVDNLRRRGVGVLYVSHRLSEVVRVADRAIVLRDGRVAGELARGAIDPGSLVRLMAGRRLLAAEELATSSASPAPKDAVAPNEGAVPHSERPPVAVQARRQEESAGSVVLRARGLRVGASAPALSFEVRAGEILGLFGLVGAGRTELLETLFGLRRAAAGTIEHAAPGRTNERPRSWSVARAMAAGVALVPEDRRTKSLVAEMTVAENLALASLAGRPLLARRSRRREQERALALCRDLDVRPAAPDAVVSRLSGGNQQKVALGKWLALAPRVLLLDEPTRGVDVAARDQIHRRLRALASTGVAIVLSSAESDEVLALADRVLVLRCGEIAGFVEGSAGNEETLLRLAAGAERP